MKMGLSVLGLAGLCCLSQIAAADEPPKVDKPATEMPPKATAQSEAGEPRAVTSSVAPAQDKSANAKPASTAASTPSKPAKAKAPGAADKLELSTATVTGDREQPKVMYIVPWKRSDMGDLEGKPMNSLVDEILAPVDRDVFKREVTYYQAVQSDSAKNEAAARPAAQGEK